MTSSGPSSSRTLTPNPLGVRDDWLAAERAASPEQTRDALIDRAAKLAPDIADLIRRYFRYLPPEEVIGDDPSQLVGAVRSNYLLAENRVPGRPSVNRPGAPCSSVALAAEMLMSTPRTVNPCRRASATSDCGE